MTDSDTITLSGLRVFANHGVFEEERINGQEFVIDVSLTLDLEEAATTDDVATTIHYGILAEQIHDAVSRDPVNLLETVAKRVLGVALAFDRVLTATVTIHKPHAPITVPFSNVAVTMTRSRGAA